MAIFTNRSLRWHLLNFQYRLAIQVGKRHVFNFIVTLFKMIEYYLISIDRASLYELDQVQDLIKNYASDWWHHHETVWVVGGGKASKWRDLIKPVLRSRISSVLVLRLPEKESRDWCFSGKSAKEKCEWFHQNY